MATFSKMKVNGIGYDVIDKQARTDVATLGESVTTLQGDMTSLETTLQGDMNELTKLVRGISAEDLGEKRLALAGYTLENGALNTADGTYNMDTSYMKHLKYVLNGEKVLEVGGYNFGANYRAWAVLDSSDNIIAKSEYNTSSANYFGTVLVPEGGKTLIVNIRHTTGSSEASRPCYIYKYEENVTSVPEIKTVKEAGGSIKFNKSFRATGQESADDALLAYRTLDVIAGETYFVYGVNISNNFPVAMLLDTNGNVSYNPFFGIGNETQVSGLKIVIPANAKTLVVNGKTGANRMFPKIEKLVNPGIETLQQTISKDVRKTTVELKSIQPDCVFGSLIGKDGETVTYDDNYIHLEQDVTPGAVYYITGRNYSRNWPLYVFVNEDGKACKVPDNYVLADSTPYFNIRVEAPLDADKLYVSSYKDSDYDIRVEDGMALDEALQTNLPVNVYNARTKIISITHDLVDGEWVENSKKTEDNLSRFGYAYAIMLHRIMTTYPLARVICCTLNECERTASISVGMPEQNKRGETVAEYNEAIERIAKIFGAMIVDHHSCGITYYNLESYMYDYSSSTGEGLHPNAAGMDLIAKQTVKDLSGIDWTGKKVSVFGDSISTFNGTGSTYNTYPDGDVTTVEQTWWYKSLITDLHMTLLTNGSGGGRSVSTIREGHASGRPKSGCNQDAIDALAVNGTDPDVIIIKQGINDFGNVGSGGNRDLNGHYHYGGL